jgi:membrane protein DedA with SNARE-associated domain
VRQEVQPVTHLFVFASVIDPTHLVKSSGYAAIFVLSVLQSCCVPTSSELTMGVAGYLSSAAGHHTLTLWVAIVVGALGELVGAYIAYFVGRFGGRAFVERYGRYILVSHRDLDRAEAWYDRHGTWGVLVSRLLPIIRNFVAVPAGIAEVPVIRFGVLTLIGSVIWDGAMALIGYELSSSYTKVMKGFSDAGYVIAVVVVIALAFVIWHRYRSFKHATAGAAPKHAPQHARQTDRRPATEPGPSARRAPRAAQPVVPPDEA